MVYANVKQFLVHYNSFWKNAMDLPQGKVSNEWDLNDNGVRSFKTSHYL
jgi:hypothetical protein